MAQQTVARPPGNLSAPPAPLGWLSSALALRSGEIAFVAAASLVVAALHIFLGRARETIWIFPDELIRLEAARLVAESGVHRVNGSVSPVEALTSYVLAPAWLFFDGDAALVAGRVITVVLFVSTVPAVYLMVREFSSRPIALLAGVTAGAVPGSWYAATLMTEALGIALVAWVVLATYRVIVTGSPAWWIAAVVLSLSGVGIRRRSRRSSRRCSSSRRAFW